MPQPTFAAYAMGQDGSNMGQIANGVLGLGGANFRAPALAADASGQNAVKQKMANAIDPATGQLLKQPQTPAEFAEVERQAQQMTSDQAKAIYAQQVSLLGYKPFSTPGTTGPGGVNPDGSYTVTTPGGSSITYPAGKGPGPAGGSTAATNYTPTVDTAVQGSLSSTLMQALNNPGMDPQIVQQMTDIGNENLATSAGASAQKLGQMAAASGMGGSGVSARALQKLNSDTAGAQADNRRNVNIAAENAKLQNRNATMNTAASYVNADKARQQSYYQFLQEQAQHDRDMAIALAGQQKSMIPNVSGGGAGSGFGNTNGQLGGSLGGGGANSGSGSNQGFFVGPSGGGGGGGGGNQPPNQPPAPPKPPAPPDKPPGPPKPPTKGPANDLFGEPWESPDPYAPFVGGYQDLDYSKQQGGTPTANQSTSGDSRKFSQKLGMKNPIIALGGYASGSQF